MNRIKELPKSSSHLLSSTQIVTSVQSVVKELIENALDGFAKSIEVKLEDYGLEKIEIRDNGNGIHADDIIFVAKPHCTSKITSHLDLDKVGTYGFRGEALAALCALSDLVITTKIAGEEMGFTYTFDHNGNVLTSKPCACNQGTSVTALNLFKNIPVRKQFYRSDKKKKDELRKVEDILISFGCIQTGVRFALFHNRNLIWQKSSVNKTREGLLQIFGNSVVDHMENCEYIDNDTQVNIEVFLPKQNAPLNCSQTAVNRSIVAINKRPVRMKIIDKLLKESFNKTSDGVHKSRFPICYISIEVPPAHVDVNFEPNKTAVAMNNTDLIVDQLSKIFSTFYSFDSNTTSDVTSKSTASLPIEVNSSSNPESSGTSHNHVKQKKVTPNIQLKQSELNPGFQNSYSNQNAKLSSKLSRKDNMKAPSFKKMKTSTGFSTPPNDIFRHINTLESFFSSSDKDEAKTAGLEVKADSNTKQNSSVMSVPKENTDVVTAQREILNSNGGVNAVPNFTESVVNENMVTVKRGLSTESVSVVPNCTKTFMNGNVANIQSEILNSNESVNITSNGVKTIMNENVSSGHPEPSSRKRHFSDPCTKIVNKYNEMNKNSETRIPVIDINGWSRGVHPVEMPIQPVFVLKPKVVGIDQTASEATLNIQSLEDTNVSHVVSPNQRKIHPFDFFCRKHRFEVSSLNPDFNNHQIAQVLTEKWSKLSVEEKAIYKNMISKAYPKNIKNKEKLGKIVSENLNKTKDTSVSLKKKVRKVKHKKVEKNIVFDVQLIKNHIPLSSCTEVQTSMDLNIMKCLAPGVWTCSQQNKLYLLNCFRLQETVVYHRLLATYQFEAEPLESPFILSSSSLGDDALGVLLQMNVTHGYGDECFISDERLTANGFKIKFLKDESEVQFEVVGMTSSIAFYGVLDLKEILHLLKEKGISAKLSNCRPGKVILYLQGEAVRIARQWPVSKKLDDVEDLLENRNSLPTDVCIHSKPFLHELYTISTED